MSRVTKWRSNSSQTGETSDDRGSEFVTKYHQEQRGQHGKGESAFHARGRAAAYAVNGAEKARAGQQTYLVHIPSNDKNAWAQGPQIGTHFIRAQVPLW